MAHLRLHFQQLSVENAFFGSVEAGSKPNFVAEFVVLSPFLVAPVGDRASMLTVKVTEFTQRESQFPLPDGLPKPTILSVSDACRKRRHMLLLAIHAESVVTLT